MSTYTRYYNLASGDIMPITTSGDESFINSSVDIDYIYNCLDNNETQSLFRIFVLYPDESIKYEIPLTDIKKGGSYSENYQNGQRRSLNFTLYNYSGDYTPGINNLWAGTRLRLDMGLKINDDLTYWFKKGIFIITSATVSESIGSREVQVTANDKFSLFENNTGKLSSTYVIPVNTDIEGLIQTILHTDMGSGNPLDSKDYIYHSSLKGKKTQVEITKSAGDTFGGLISDLATQLSAEYFYNANGNLTFVPINEVTLDTDKPLLYHFNSGNNDISQLNFNFDYNSVINRIIIIGTSSSGGTFTYSAANDDPGSPLSWQRIGYRTGDVITDSNIYSLTLAKERAEYELRNQLILKSSVSTNIIFNPFMEVNNLITISDDFFDLQTERFLIQSVSCSLDFSNQMSITVTNLRNLPFIIH